MEHFLALLQTVIYAISSSLLYPVMLALILLAGWMVVLGGSILSEGLGRRKHSKEFDLARHLKEIRQCRDLPETIKGQVSFRVRLYAQKLKVLLSDPDEFLEQRVESLIQTKELKLLKEVDRVRMVVRVGPSLGLMGTLIPMGTGLAALTQGNMAEMSASLIIAFTTTVLGLALGILAYLFSTLKARWVQEDIRNIELITEAMTGEPES